MPPRDIALSYLFWIPDSMFMVLPAAVLFATVFSIGAFTRHAELTAAKASGISFYRMIAPILPRRALAFGLDLGLGKIVPITNQRRSQLLLEDKAQLGTTATTLPSLANTGACIRPTSCARIPAGCAIFKSSGKDRDRHTRPISSRPIQPRRQEDRKVAPHDGAMDIVSDTTK